MDRTTELKEAAATFLEHHRRWENAPQRQVIDELWIDALRDLFDVFSNGAVPRGCEALNNAVVLLSEEFDKADSTGALTHLNEKTGFLDRMDGVWAALKAIGRALDALKPKQEKPLETVAVLNAQNVPHEQIARMYDLYAEDGRGMYWLIAQEIEKPGSVIDPKTNKARPEFLKQSKKPHADDEGRERPTMRKRLWSRLLQDEPTADDDPPCPETPRELWQQGVSLDQSARMLKKPQAEVAELFKSFEAERAGVVSEETAAKIHELSAAGLDAKKIAKKVDLQPAQVTAILAQEPATA